MPVQQRCYHGTPLPPGSAVWKAVVLTLCHLFSVLLLLLQSVLRVGATVVSAIGLECPVPDSMLSLIYDNSTNPSTSQCGIIPLRSLTFKLIKVLVSANLNAVIAGTATGSVVLSSDYKIAPCADNSDCLHGGTCSGGICQCSFGYCGAFCNAPADNICNFATLVCAHWQRYRMEVQITRS